MSCRIEQGRGPTRRECVASVALRALAGSAVLAAVLFAAPAAAAPPAATMYVCTDAAGRTITGDRPPPECADREIRELRTDGSVKRVIAPPLTPEQIERRAAEERLRRQQEAEARTQRQRDQALLAAYLNEADIDKAEQSALEGQRASIARAAKRLKELQDERRRLDEEAEFYKGRALPAKLKAAFESNAQMLRTQQQVLADTEAEMNRIAERYQSDRRRYRALTAGEARK